MKLKKCFGHRMMNAELIMLTDFNDLIERALGISGGLWQRVRYGMVLQIIERVESGKRGGW
jgi:ABC-type cobalamin transport system ATPase subunit